jgi:YD repeat-containing protein
MLARSAVRPKIVAATRRYGREGAGPRMASAKDVGELIEAAARKRFSEQGKPFVPARPTAPAPALSTPVRHGTTAAETRGSVRRTQSLALTTSSGTGINQWWHYEEQNVPGGGHVMVNVGTGNLLLQEDDMSVAHKGIAMEFRRTYNSQSLHDVNGDDGGYPGMYGNGWTTTWDAHITGTSSVINVFDIDGAEYTYTLASDGVTWAPPSGQHATLVPDTACGFLWTKKSGTTYHFYAPYQPATCPDSYSTFGGYAGRLYKILGRNTNNHIALAYSWLNGNESPSGQITQITATTESGMVTTLNFANVNGYQLLQQIVYPDGQTTVNYSYDSDGNLTSVVRPGPSTNGTVTETYGYQTGPSGYLLHWAASPRWAASTGGCGTMVTDCGGYLAFGYLAGATNATTTLNQIQHIAWVDPTVPDGVSTSSIQTQPATGSGTASYPYLFEFFDIGGPGVAGASSSQDTDGHYTVWIVDALGRSTQTQECPAPQGTPSMGMSCPGTDLFSNETWDANNNLVSEIDPRGYETDHAFDANGNEVAVAEPLQSVTAPNGTLSVRPTQLYDYDAYNNIVAYCDQRATNSAGANWTVTPTTNLDSL